MIVKKITTGFVIQDYDTEKKAFVSQEFIAGDQVDWEGDDGAACDEPDASPYLNFDMVQPELDAPLTVKRWLRTGELSEHLTSQKDIIEECGRHLDGSCAHEILGEAIFEATNGKYYVITTEALIDECNPEYIKSVLAELEEEAEEENE